MPFDEDAFRKNNPDALPEDWAVHHVLAVWFDRLADGTASNYLPDFAYPRLWTAEDLDSYIEWLDTYVWKQANWVKGNRGIAADAGPGYARLEPAQRLAMMQELHAALLPYPAPPLPEPEVAQEFTSE